MHPVKKPPRRPLYNPKAISILRRRAHLTQHDLAAAAEVTVSTVAAAEQGHLHRMQLATIIALAHGLRVPIKLHLGGIRVL